MDVFHHKNIKNQNCTVREVMSAFRTDGSSRDVVFLVGDQQLSYHSQVLKNAFPLLRTLLPNVSTNMCPCEAYTSKSSFISITLEDVSLKVVEQIMLTVYDPTKLMYFSQKDIIEVKALFKMLGADMRHYCLVDSNSSQSSNESNTKTVMLKKGVTSEEEILISADEEVDKEIGHEVVNNTGTLSEHVPVDSEPQVPYQTAVIESEETNVVEMNPVLNHQERAGSFSVDTVSTTCSYNDHLTKDDLKGGDSSREIVQGKETDDFKKHANLVDQNGDEIDLKEKIKDKEKENEDLAYDSNKVSPSVEKGWSENETQLNEITYDAMDETNLGKITDVLLDNDTNCVGGSVVCEGLDEMEVNNSSKSSAVRNFREESYQDVDEEISFRVESCDLPRISKPSNSPRYLHDGTSFDSSHVLNDRNENSEEMCDSPSMDLTENAVLNEVVRKDEIYDATFDSTIENSHTMISVEAESKKIALNNKRVEKDPDVLLSRNKVSEVSLEAIQSGSESVEDIVCKEKLPEEPSRSRELVGSLKDSEDHTTAPDVIDEQASKNGKL